MSLEEKLASIRSESDAMFPSAVKEKFRRAADGLVESGIKNRALDVGAKAPDFSLPDTEGEMVSSASLLRDGPLVLTVYRGVW